MSIFRNKPDKGDKQLPRVRQPLNANDFNAVLQFRIGNTVDPHTGKKKYPELTFKRGDSTNKTKVVLNVCISNITLLNRLKASRASIDGRNRYLSEYQDTMSYPKAFYPAGLFAYHVAMIIVEESRKNKEGIRYLYPEARLIEYVEARDNGKKETRAIDVEIQFNSIESDGYDDYGRPGEVVTPIGTSFVYRVLLSELIKIYNAEKANLDKVLRLDPNHFKTRVPLDELQKEE